MPSSSNSDEYLIVLQFRAAANMIVDALLMANIISSDNAEQAMEIITEELVVRRAIGKL